MSAIPNFFKKIILKKLNDAENSDFFKVAPFWLGAFITGIISYAYAKAFTFAEHKFLELMNFNTYYALIVCPTGFIAAWYMVYKFAPNAKGSGIPQVLASIELSHNNQVDKYKIRKLISLPITLIKILSTLTIALAGGAVGREGPTIQISAYIFHSIGIRFKKYWHPLSQDIYFISGGAAGIAAAFNTPLGGIVYAIEELSKTSFHKFRTSLFSAVIISGIIAQILSGPYLFIGSPTLHAFSSKHLPYSIFIGLTAGICGAFFGKILFWISKIRNKIQNPIALLWIATLCGLSLALIIIFVDISAAGSGRLQIKQLLFGGKESSIELTLIRFFTPIISYFSGTAGGVFAPSLSAGATIGSLLADIFSSPYKNTFIILGMIGFLSGFTAAPFTSFLIVLEMTDKHSIVLSMMLTSISATLVSQLLDKKPFYEKMKSFFIDNDSPKSSPRF